MRICIVSDLYYPYPGGISEHVYHASQELRKLGHTVKILTTSYKTLLWHDYVREQMPDVIGQMSDVIRIGIATPFPINRSIGIIPIGFRLDKKVQKQVTTEVQGASASSKFDIIHMHGPSPFLPLLALKYSKATNILTFHAFAPPEADGLKLNKYFAHLIQPYIRKIDAAIVVSNAALATMQRYMQVPYKIIPNGVDTNRFSPKVEGLEKFIHSDKLERGQGGHNILFVGRFEPRKGLKYLIQAFQMVRREFPDAKLIVIGKGWLSKIKNHPESPETSSGSGAKIKNIYFEGFVPPEILPRYYASCDIFCSPATERESFGIVLLEAMASGKPVVATNIPGYREVVTDGLNGILVEPKNPKAIADAIIGIFKNNDLKARLIKDGRETALNYSWDKITRKIENFYYEIADKKIPRSWER